MRTWCSGAVLIAITAGAVAAAAEGPSAVGFGEVMTITEVQVPVQVFADDEPLFGLVESDFEVYDEGERRELSAFEVVDLTTRAGTREGMPGSASKAGSEGAHRTLLVLFDLAFNSPRKLSRAAQGIERMLDEQLHPDDRVAIATFDLSQGVTLHSGLTSRRDETRAALAQLRRMFAGKTIEVGPLGAVLTRSRSGQPIAESAASLVTLSTQLGATAALALGGRSMGFEGPAGSLARPGEAESFAIGDGDSRANGVVNSVAATSAEQVGGSLATDANQRSAVNITRATTEAFAEIVTLLRDVPGQRHFLYLSRGLPAVFGRPPFHGAEHAAIAPLMAEMFRAFKSSGWTLQAIDISGVPDPFGGSTPGDASHSTVGFGSDPLVNTAKGTGGEVYENFNDIALATRQVIEKTQLTYLLTFAIANPPADGRYHRLAVRLKGGNRGRRVVHREGYYNPRPTSKRSVLEQRLDLAEELLGDTVGGDFEANSFVAAFAPQDGFGRVAVWLEVPGAAILGEKTQGKLSARLEAYLIDRDQRFADSRVGQLAFDLETVEPRLKSGGLRVFLPLTAPPGEHRLRLRLVEEASGASWMGTASVSVPSAEGLLRLLPPVFPELNPEGLVTRLAGEGAAEIVGNPFRFGGRELVPRARGLCRSGENTSVLLLIEGEELPGRELVSRILDGTEKPVAADRLNWISREERGEDGLERLLGTLSCLDLAPGDYWLEVELHSSRAVPRSRVRSAFAVLPPR